MTTRDRLNEIIALCHVALSELPAAPKATPPSDYGRVCALVVDKKPPSIAAIRKELGCSQGKASRLRARVAEDLRVALLPSGSRVHEPAAGPEVQVQIVQSPAPAPVTAPDLTPEGRAFAAYQQCAALNGWPAAPPMNAHVRFLLQQRVADVGLGGFTMALTMAANAAFLREADRKTAKPFVNLQWLAERDNFERITEGKWEKVHPPGKIDPVVPSTPPEIERAIMRGDA